MRRQRIYDFRTCICEHANLLHGPDGICRCRCLCVRFIPDMWLTRIVLRRQITMFARANGVAMYRNGGRPVWPRDYRQ